MGKSYSKTTTLNSRPLDATVSRRRSGFFMVARLY